MNSTYAQKSSTVQKTADTKAASVLDSSAQNESLQRKADMANNAAQRAPEPRPNNTGMPDNLKSGIESLSGFSMDDVRVHYNSSKPATVQALAYTQGTDIHVAPGQEKCLPHEAWHVAQQMAGRVSPTTNINGMPVNDNAALEHEADVMGEKAVQCKNENKSVKNICFNALSIQRFPNLPDGYSVVSEGGKWESGCTISRDQTGSDEVFDSKVDALKKIASEAGRLGENTEKYLGGDEFFQANVFAKYKTLIKKRKTTLILTYHYGKDWSGYVVKVSKKNNTTDVNAVMKSDSGVVYKGPGEKIFPQYSHRHTSSVTNPILEDAKKKVNSVPFEERADTYTKLAGEGARFDCVRRNIEKIKDDTVFFSSKFINASTDLNDSIPGVTFRDLWLSWKESFDKRYNIPDQDVAGHLESNLKCDLRRYDGSPVTLMDGKKNNRIVLNGNANFSNEEECENECQKIVCAENRAVNSDLVSYDYLNVDVLFNDCNENLYDEACEYDVASESDGSCPGGEKIKKLCDDMPEYSNVIKKAFYFCYVETNETLRTKLLSILKNELLNHFKTLKNDIEIKTTPVDDSKKNAWSAWCRDLFNKINEKAGFDNNGSESCDENYIFSLVKRIVMGFYFLQWFLEQTCTFDELIEKSNKFIDEEMFKYVNGVLMK